MPIVDLHEKQLPPSAIISSLWASNSVASDPSVVDISDLTPEQPLGVTGFIWREVPIVGPDGRITGVLCEDARIGIPDEFSVRTDEDATRIYVYVHDIANLLAVIDGGLRLLNVKTAPDDRAVIVDRLHRAIQRGASLSRRLLHAARSDQEERAPTRHNQVVIDVSDLLDRTPRADVVVHTDVDLCLRQSGRSRSKPRTSSRCPTGNASRSPCPTRASAYRPTSCRGYSIPTSRRRSPGKNWSGP
jgi:hypothetical protein